VARESRAAQRDLEIFDYIEIFYNRQRRHGTLGMRSPADFENSALDTPGADLAASRLASPQTMRFTAPTTAAVALSTEPGKVQR
jgi:hypothetical protein